ncbi:translation initiation factor IF-2 [Helicobacter sp. MIT 21-1697]|uniref:translation initiation factor IF-2 n=1 Tax=Helicobacter sp. MIT 21-1697 TaxID=2993733 RepID=UPI00224A7C33|nr:translation initiation factor IF-2 [Helicobacter sp. MIT 21-1697]MCX2717744.1 translation initiation factor IF-2 [Helicobacter sp. MIT 21-1697]
MEKIRLSDFAKEFGKEAKFAYEKAKEMGLSVKTPSSSLTQEEAAALFEYINTGVNSYVPTNKAKDKKAAKAPKKSTTKSSQSATKEKESKEKETKKATKSSKTAKKTTQKQKNKDAQNEVEQDSALPQIQASQNKRLGKKTETNDMTAPLETKPKVGLRIVRKNDALQEQPSVVSKKDENKRHAPSYKELLADTADEEYKKHKKDKPKPKVAHKHTEQKIHILDDRDISFHSDYDDEQDEIMLFDLNEREVRDEEEENQIRQAIAERVHIHRKNPWMNEGSIKRGGKRRKPVKAPKNVDKVKGPISIPEEIRVYEFAELIKAELKDVIKVLFNLGVMATKNDFLDRDAIEILADEFELEISIQDAPEQNIIESAPDIDIPLLERPPVVTIMGHVDHGKTSLLDYIRNSRIASGEAGGITQHIGAYMVEKNGKKISFIDTPGHEAFTQMRSRGAQVTDIAIIVIAADDGVKQQTIEALNHAKAANVQIIIAMNKMDKENANPDKLKAECAEIGFTPNEWGGEYEFIPISAKSGDGIENLLETILIQAEVLELKAPHQGRAKAIVLEASLEKGRGPVATIIVQNGVLNVGDSVVADTAFGRVRALLDDRGQNISQLSPSGVAVVTGLSEVPSAGAIFQSVENDAIAREYAQKRASYLRQKELSKSTKVTFDELGEMVAQGNLKTLPLIVKADTQGSLEAIKVSLEKLSNDEVRVNIIGFGVGGISESDIALCATSTNSLILGFNVRPTGNVKAKAKELGVEIKTYSIIYTLLDDIKALLGGLMSPIVEEENTGQAEVRETFNIPKVGTIAGCMVVDGSIQKGIKVRLIRDGVVVHTGAIVSLKRFKDDVKEVSKGYECGIMLENYNDIKVGDVFETYKEISKTKIL